MKKNNTTESVKDRDRKRVAAAIMELLTNPETPEELQDDLAEFLCDAGCGSITGRYTEVAGGLQALEHLLAFVEWGKANPNWPGERIIGERFGANSEVSHAEN
jgi:5'-deoxynucleotidase YfbR-like HD superfamily hydrolase